MPEQRELLLTFPELAPEAPLIPVRMVNEFVYCPRLAYLEWAQGEFAHNADTIDGAIKHKRVDHKGGSFPEAPAKDEVIHARSISLSSTRLGITAKLDLVEGEGNIVTPVDYKRGSRPHVAAGAYDPERVQICAQGLLLREHGFDCDIGIIYFAGSRERVRVPFDDALVEKTLSSINALRGIAQAAHIPPPLEDSPKCPRCSLVGICLPDELRFLNRSTVEPRPLFPAIQDALPLYVQSPRAFIRKDGEVFTIEIEKEKQAEARIVEVSQVALFGHAMLSASALHECFSRDIPVSWHSYGGWFIGHTIGTGHHNVETRTFQYQASFDPTKCLQLARGWVAAKSGLELDLDEYELEIVRVDDVMLDAGLASVGHAGPERRRHCRLAIEDVQFAGRHRNHDIVVVVAVPAGMAARRKAPFGDDHAVVLDLHRRLGGRALLFGHGENLMGPRCFVR